jgi:RNA polymerase sigma factor (sigma-70 family)
MRKEVLYFDLQKIERNDEPLCKSEQEVAKRARFDPRPGLRLRLDLEQALEGLPPRQREAIELAAAGHHQEEIARAMGIRQQSANELLEKARAALKKNLQGGL